MRKQNKKTIAAAAVATIVVSLTMLTGCEGRRMSNMTPTGETVELNIDEPAHAPADSIIPDTAI